jgi:pyruvate formate lyase activating enzyme
VDTIRKYRGWVDGVCITGGEPTLLPHLIQMIEDLRREHMKIKLDTNGSHPEVLANLIDKHLVDHVAMDVKAPLAQEVYSRCCGVSVDLEKVKASISVLKERLPSYEFRITVVPSLHTREDLLQLAEELRGSKKLTLKNYNPVNPLNPQLKKEKPYSDQEIEALQDEINRIL